MPAAKSRRTESDTPDASKSTPAVLRLLSDPLLRRILEAVGDDGRSVKGLAASIGAPHAEGLDEGIERLRKAGLVILQKRAGGARLALTQEATELVGASRELFRSAANGHAVPTSKEVPQRLMAVLKAFADPVRLRLLNVMTGASEVCVCHLHEALDLPQSTVSRHLAVLRSAGLVTGKRRGTWMYYRLSQSASDLEAILTGELRDQVYKGGIFDADLRHMNEVTACSDRPGGR